MNRHDVFIWDASERGLPKDLAQALEMAEKLSQIKDEPSDKIKRFAQQIEDYVAQQEDEEWDEYLGGFNTLVANCCHAALNVELPDESWERMLALLVEKATGRGLVVVDTEMMVAFLPHGQVLPYEARREWEELIKEQKKEDALALQDPHLPKTLNKYIKWVEPIYDEYLAKHGFVRIDKPEWMPEEMYKIRYKRHMMDGVDQYIDFSHAGTYPYFSTIFGAFFYMTHPLIISILDRFSFSKIMPIIFFMPLSNIFKTTDYDVNVVSRIEVESQLAVVKREVISLLDHAKDIKGLDALMNGTVSTLFRNSIQKWFFMPHCLIVARLADNPQFEELAVGLGTYGPKSGRNWGSHAPHQITEWPKLVKYLREEVKPLV